MTRLFKMPRHALALALSAALALSPVSATKAHAENEAAFIAGVIALMIAGGAFGDVNVGGSSANKGSQNRGGYYGGSGNRGGSYRPNRRAVPSSCLFQIDHRYGTSAYFGKSCVLNAGVHPSQLPGACEVTVRRSNGQSRRAYELLCMRQHGFVIDGRHAYR